MFPVGRFITWNVASHETGMIKNDKSSLFKGLFCNNVSIGMPRGVLHRVRLVIYIPDRVAVTSSLFASCFVELKMISFIYHSILYNRLMFR